MKKVFNFIKKKLMFEKCSLSIYKNRSLAQDFLSHRVGEAVEKKIIMIEPFDELEWIMTFFNNDVRLTPETIDRVRNFTLLWNIFETFSCKKDANIPKIKQAVININERSPITKEFVDPYLDYFAERYTNPDKTAKELFDGLSFRDTNGDINAKEFVYKVLLREITEPIEILKALLIILYRFRNNLFHGQKQVIHLNGQISNFTVANSLLSKILNIMKENYLI